jgi:cytoskeleton protein RodZ
MQRLFEQVARRLVYIVLTAAIAVPIWLATRPHLGMVAHDAAPLDVPASLGSEPSVPLDAAASDDPSPLVASLAPLPSQAQAAPALSLQVTGDSWVQITAPDGHMLEQALLHAGAVRRYAAGEVSGVVLGDANAVKVRQDGRAIDLAPFSRSNVARFTVSSAGSLAPAAD